MRLKSYFAATVEAAMTLAAKELGDEAMLVYSREATPETRYLGRYEVVFSLPEPPEVKPEPRVEPKVETPPPNPVLESKSEPSPALELLVGELTALRSKVDRLGTQLRTASPVIPAVRQRLQPAECQSIVDLLLAADVTPELVTSIVETVDARLAANPAQTVRAALQRSLIDGVKVDARIGKKSGGPGVVVVVGPPGAGKTTAVVKLAARYLVETKHAPLLLSFDTYRIGGADQLRTFASLLGVPFQAFESSTFLLDAIQQNSTRDLILVDTAGYGEKDLDAAEDLINFLSICPSCEVQLTLSATTKTADLTRAVERFERFRPSKLIFTRLDETCSLGSVWSEVVRTGRSLSFVSEGQQVPEDLHPANAERLVEAILGDWQMERHSPSIAANPPQTVRPPEPPKWLAGAFQSVQKPAWTGVSAG
ncbi:MAG: hypothetical protein IT168_04260 [Bryobacterales bacterium]|nr:hypothetical protein [Bryobacterales bacterium]